MCAIARPPLAFGLTVHVVLPSSGRQRRCSLSATEQLTCMRAMNRACLGWIPSQTYSTLYNVCEFSMCRCTINL